MLRKWRNKAGRLIGVLILVIGTFYLTTANKSTGYEFSSMLYTDQPIKYAPVKVHLHVRGQPALQFTACIRMAIFFWRNNGISKR